MQVSIDIVIPSFRLEEACILSILNLRKPTNAVVKFYVLCDNPTITPSSSIQALVDNKNVFLSVNEKNSGAAETRNKGIESGTGDWILFLDDDIVAEENLLGVYADAIRQYPNEIGFIGMIQLPPPQTAFTKAVQKSGSMDIFGIAAQKSAHAWGATANIMVKRKTVGKVRFSKVYPKSGGGEDIDFFINIREQNNFKNYKTLPGAVVFHPWWKNERVDFRRPFRYGVGNSWLPQLNPKYAYRDFLNTMETLQVTLILLFVSLLLATKYVTPLLLFAGGIIAIEVLATLVQGIKRGAGMNVAVYFYLVLLRVIYQIGLLWGNLCRFRIKGISERFNDDGRITKTHFLRFNSYKITKWIFYPVLLYFMFRKFF